MKPQIPKKYQPKGYELLYEDRDLLVGNKAAGFVTVPTKWDGGNNLFENINGYIRKGNARSRNTVHVVHRLDQGTTGVLIFAKTAQAQAFLKDHWPTTVKIYYAVVLGRLKTKSGKISSYLLEDDDYMMHSSQDERGKLAHTEYEVIGETAHLSLLKINLLTGRKNQIRVHMADLGHPLHGDSKYGDPTTKQKNLALHASSITFTHPHSRARIQVEAPVPEHIRRLVPHNYPVSS